MEEKTAAYGSRVITTSISNTLWVKAKAKNISWSEAMRRGITGILADLGDEDFVNPLQLQRKIAELSNKYEIVFQENLKMAEALDKYRGVKNGTDTEQ